MKSWGVVVVIVSTLALTGCAGTANPGDTLAESPSASATPTPTPTPTVVAVDPGDYATEMAGSMSPEVFDGVDFDSADGNIHCGIFSPYDPTDVGVDNPYNPHAGCMADSVDFAWPETPGVGGGVSATNVLEVNGDQVALASHVTDVEYAGQFPSDYPNLKRVPNGSSITWASVICVASEDSILCRNQSSGHGFQLSRASYTLF